MYDDLTSLSSDPSEHEQDGDSALLRYLSLLGSANRFRQQQFQDQYSPQDASVPDFLKQVRGVSDERPQSDALQRLNGLFGNDSDVNSSSTHDQTPNLFPDSVRWSGLPDNSAYSTQSFASPKPLKNQSSTGNAGTSISPSSISSSGMSMFGSAAPSGSLDRNAQESLFAPRVSQTNSFAGNTPQSSFGDTSNNLLTPGMNQPDSEDKSSDDLLRSVSSQAPNRVNTAPKAASMAAPADGTPAPQTAKPARQSPPPQKQSPIHERKELQVPDLSVDLKSEKNDPNQVRQLQHLLNLAQIDDPELGKEFPNPLDEDGRVTPAMLQMIAKYQEIHKLPKELTTSIVVKGQKKPSWTLRQLAKSRLADSRWNLYDEVIKKDVTYYNNLFKDRPGFQPLDWELVKAILWTENQGPDVKGGTWYTRPMQIGNKAINRHTGKKDPAMDIIKYGGEHTREWVPEEVRRQLIQSEFGDTNVRAGIAYLYHRALRTLQQVEDGREIETALLQPNENPTTFADHHKTTVKELYRLNPWLQDGTKAKKLKPGIELKFIRAHEQPTWDWRKVMSEYNSQTTTPDNASTVDENYGKLQKLYQMK